MLSLIIALLASAGALAFALVVARQIVAEDEGDDTMKEIALAIQEGASAFLQREYTFLAVFVVVVTIVLAIFIDYDVLDRFGDQARQPHGCTPHGLLLRHRRHRVGDGGLRRYADCRASQRPHRREGTRSASTRHCGSPSPPASSWA